MLTEKIDIVRKRYDEIYQMISNPDIIADQKKYIELNKELKELRKIKSDEYGPFNKKMQAIADVWSVLIGKKLRPHQVALMYAMAKIIRANNEYKYDSYIDAINYLVQADEIHREDVSELVDSYFPTTTKEDVSV